MVRYTKRSFKRGRKTSWYNRKYSTMQIAKKAWQATKYLKGIINSEKHISDTTHSAIAQNAIFRMINLSQGMGPADRQGNSILLKSIYIRGHVEINPAVTGHSRFSLAIVRDNQQIADTTPSLSDIFESATDSESMLLRSTAGRFSVIYRKTYILTPSSGGRPVVPIDKFIKLNKHVRFNGPNVSDIQKGSYFLCLLTSEGTNFPTLSIQDRITYYDN